MNPAERAMSRATWAVRYAAGGWPVLPLHSPHNGLCSCGRADCPSPGKHPRLKHGLTEATTDAAIVAGWWQRWPEANIGLRTGDIFDVLDIDGEEGASAIKELVAEHGQLPGGPRAATGGGGRHVLFAPTGLGNRAALVPHVDWRGRGGYIVAPPSLHASGLRYTWVRPPETALQPVPGWLRLILDPPKPPPRPRPLLPTPTVGANGNAYGQRALDAELAELARAPEGMRNHQLNIAGFNLFQLVGGGELPDELVAGELRRVALTTGLNDREIDATIGSSRAAGTARPRGAPARPQGPTNGAAVAQRHEPPPPGDEDAPPPYGPVRHNLTDVGNGARLVDLYGPDLRHVRLWGSWLLWDGARWKKDDTGLVIEKAKAVARSVFTEAATEEEPGRRKALASWAHQSEHSARVHAMVGLSSSDPKVATRPDELDRDRWKLTVANGTLDLASGELRRHRRTDLITKLVDVAYDRRALCPAWDWFLERVLPDPEVRAFLQRAVGYALTGSVREQCLFFLYGLGANGKSTLITTLLALLGDYGRQADPALLMESKHETHPTNVADLQGARFVATIEAGSGRRLDETLVKQLTGGDRVKARFMRQDFFEFDPTHKLFLAANHKPVIKGNDHAIWRRVHLVPFTVTIAQADRDDRLGDRLLAELPGILRWAVDGCLEWKEGGLQVPEQVAAATNAYRAEEDLLGDFLAQCCVEEQGVAVAASDLYKAYREWAETTGERAWGQTVFGRALGERGFDVERLTSGRKARLGLRLLTQASVAAHLSNSENRSDCSTVQDETAGRTVSNSSQVTHVSAGAFAVYTENSSNCSELFGAGDADPCWGCGAPATAYSPSGVPHCPEHPPTEDPEP